jgi:hypothetical protein
MGDYGRIKATKEEIKIGTCGSYYYLTHAQKEMVTYSYYRDGDSYRLLFEDEQKVKPGCFDVYNRGIPIINSKDFFTDEQIEQLQPGIMQLSKNGMLVNIPCYHNLKLEKNTGSIKLFFNGREEVMELKRMKELKSGKLTFIIGCKNCNSEYVLDLEEIELLKVYYENSKDLKLNVDYVINYNKAIK